MNNSTQIQLSNGFRQMGFWQGKGTLFRNIQNTGRLYYSVLGSRRGFYILVGSYL